jgi:hypothetical protein
MSLTPLPPSLFLLPFTLTTPPLTPSSFSSPPLISSFFQRQTARGSSEWKDSRQKWGRRRRRRRRREREGDRGWGAKNKNVYTPSLGFKRMPPNSLNSSNSVSSEARGKIGRKRERKSEGKRGEKSERVKEREREWKRERGKERDYYLFTTNNVDFKM